MIRFSQEEDLTGSRNSVDLTPMIDMVFILLVFFLLTSVVMLPAITVNLPEAETGDNKPEVELTVTLKKDGTILLNDKVLRKDEIIAELNSIKEQQAVKEVFIQSDKNLSFGTVIEITDLVRKTGITTISFIVEQSSGP